MRKVLNDPWPLIIFVIAISIRLIYIIEIRDHPFFTNPQLDSRHYDDWAWGIAQGNWIGGDKVFFASPFYAYFLAIVYSIFGHKYFVVKLIQIFLGSATWVVTYWIGKELFSKKVGIVAALIGTFYSYSIFLDGELLKNSLAAFTTTLAIYTALKAKKKDSALSWLISGILLGITALNQPNALLFIPLFAVWGTDWSRGLKGLLPVSLFVMGSVLAISPAAIRNYIVEKDVVLISYNGGINFFQGNNLESDGGMLTSKLYKLIPQREEGRTREIPEKALGRELKSSEISQYWFSLGKRFIYETPLSFIWHTIKKLLLFWNWYEVPDNIDYYFFKQFSKILSLPLPSFGFLAPLALLGLFLSIGEWRRHLLSYGIISVFMVSIVMFYVIGRYRLPIIPLLCIYAGNTLIVTYNRIRERDYKKVILIALILTGAGVVSNFKILRYPPEHSQKILGNLYMKKEMFGEAMQEYRSAIKAFPFDSSLRLSYATSLEKSGIKDDALNEYKRLLSFELDISTKAKINSAIGSIFLEKGDRVGAAKAYEEALRLDNGLPEALNNLAYLYLLEGKRLKDAETYVGKALAIEPDTPEYLDTLALILMKEGKRKEAVKLFRDAILINPKSIEIRRHLKEAEEMSQRKK